MLVYPQISMKAGKDTQQLSIRLAGLEILPTQSKVSYLMMEMSDTALLAGKNSYRYNRFPL